MTDKKPAKITATAKTKPKKKPVCIGRKPKGMSARCIRFCHEYVIYLNGTQSAIRAGYSKTHADVTACRLLRNVQVKTFIDELKAKVAEKLEIRQEDIVEELHRNFFADANELTEYRRICCRYCHGTDNQYQYTPAELKKAKSFHERKNMEAEAMGIKLTAAQKKFDTQGGIGYDPRKLPSLECPECFGEGHGEVFMKDTRMLSKQARAMYAGVKQTKDGTEVMMHSKQAMGQLLMRHLGMLNDKVKVSGDADNPLMVTTKVVVVPAKNVATIGITKIGDKTEL